jgi:hypothetical protein
VSDIEWNGDAETWEQDQAHAKAVDLLRGTGDFVLIAPDPEDDDLMAVLYVGSFAFLLVAANAFTVAAQEAFARFELQLDELEAEE